MGRRQRLYLFKDKQELFRLGKLSINETDLENSWNYSKDDELFKQT